MPAMFATVRANSFRAVLPCVLAFAASNAFAQADVNDVHISNRVNVADMATAAYETASTAGYAGGNLIRTNVNLVMVPVSITDDLHRPIVGLDQQNFQLFEGNKAQEIKNFSSEDTPVSVGILVDVSGSMSYKLEQAGTRSSSSVTKPIRRTSSS